MAGVCLVHGEAYFLPLMSWFLLPYLALVFLAYRAEGRWVLPNWGANLAGVLIVAGMFLWVRHQPGAPGALRGLPVLIRLVPYTGPFLMALLTVQLFRARGPEDFWRLQGMGLLQVALGCVLAGGALFGLLMSVYLACALGCLVLHYLCAPGTVGAPPSWRWLLAFVGRFAVVAGALALAVFLVTPRSSAPVWDPFQRFASRTPQARAAQLGPFQGANLNGMGPVELSREEAFTYRAYTPGPGGTLDPKPNLSRELRFRCLVLENYDQGQWPTDPNFNAYRDHKLQHPWDRLPDLGPHQFYLDFDVSPQLSGGLVLAEPVRLGRLGAASPRPVKLLDFAKQHPPLFFVHPYYGSLMPVPNLTWQRYHYRQVTALPPDPDRVLAEIRDQGYIRTLTQHSLPKLEKWTADLLRRLAADPLYHLPAEALVPDPRDAELLKPIGRNYRERVARALCKYLTESGRYTYSLDQRRKDLNLDVVEDFLKNVREGHCERFASALVLMLRTQGVPARLIKGYRGAESLGEGRFLVRQNMAHAWAEVLVSRPTDDGGPPHEWLTLDPSPLNEAPRGASAVAEWWKDKTSAGASMWQRLIVNYDAQQQASVLASVSPPSVLRVVAVDSLVYVAPPLLGLALVAAGVGLRLRAERRPSARARTAGLACYARLLKLLARRGPLRRAAAQTPRELAAAAGGALAARPATAALADLPARVVDLFYRVRFGGEPAAADEVGRLNARLDELAAALRRTGPLFSGGAG
jgi:transglutaminase-like putative cysteine protease